MEDRQQVVNVTAAVCRVTTKIGFYQQQGFNETGLPLGPQKMNLSFGYA